MIFRMSNCPTPTFQGQRIHVFRSILDSQPVSSSKAMSSINHILSYPIEWLLVRWTMNPFISTWTFWISVRNRRGKHVNLPTLHGWNSQHTFQAPSWRMTNMHELIAPTQQGRVLARLQPYKLCKSHISLTKSNTWNILKLIDIAWDMVSFSILTRCLDSLPSKSPMERMTSSPCHYSSTLYSFHQPTCGWPDWDDPDLPHALSQMWTPNAVTGLVSWDLDQKID